MYIMNFEIRNNSHQIVNQDYKKEMMTGVLGLKDREIKEHFVF